VIVYNNNKPLSGFFGYRLLLPGKSYLNDKLTLIDVKPIKLQQFMSN